MRNKTAAMLCLILTINIACTACGTDGSSGGPDDAVARDPVPLSSLELPEEYEIEDLYQDTKIEGLYEIPISGLEGYNISEAEINGDFVLLKLQELSLQENNSDDGFWGITHLMLFHLGMPQNRCIYEVTDQDADYRLLGNGKMAKFSYEGDYSVYDMDFQLLYEETGINGSLEGFEGEDIWYYTNDHKLELHREGSVLIDAAAEGSMFGGGYIGTVDGKAYFRLVDADYNSIVGAVDLTENSFSLLDELTMEPVPGDGMLYYYAEDNWYTAPAEDPQAISSFPMDFPGEYEWKLDRDYLLGLDSSYNEKKGMVESTLHVYDLKDGKIHAEISEEAMGLDGSIDFMDYQDKRVIFCAYEWSTGKRMLYLWDLTGK